MNFKMTESHTVTENLSLMFFYLFEKVVAFLDKMLMNVRPISTLVIEMHDAGIQRARMNALVMVRFGSGTVLIVIITIHVGIILVQKTQCALRKMINN